MIGQNPQQKYLITAQSYRCLVDFGWILRLIQILMKSRKQIVQKRRRDKETGVSLKDLSIPCCLLSAGCILIDSQHCPSSIPLSLILKFTCFWDYHLIMSFPLSLPSSKPLHVAPHALFQSHCLLFHCYACLGCGCGKMHGELVEERGIGVFYVIGSPRTVWNYTKSQHHDYLSPFKLPSNYEHWHPLSRHQKQCLWIREYSKSSVYRGIFSNSQNL